MSKSDTFENDFLKLILWGTAIANLADNASSAPLTNFYLSAHTADPGEAGSAQTTSECNYTGYARVAVPRSVSGMTIAANVAALAANFDFPNPTNATNLPQTITYWSLGTASSGAGKILWRFALAQSIVVNNTGVTPRATTGTTITED